MSNVRTIAQIFNERLFQIPDYQRGYAWEERQLSDFLDDLELLKEGKEHYTGTLVLHKKESSKRILDKKRTRYECFDVVDGQQRLTTVVILLNALHREMERHEPLSDSAKDAKDKYLFALDPNELPLYKLRLNRDCDSFWQSNILKEHPSPLPATNSAQNRLEMAKGHFESYIQSKKKEFKEANEFIDWLDTLYLKLTQQLMFSTYEVESSAEVGVIFEVMNNRGKPLSEMEKVKNYLLYLSSNLDVEQHELPDKINRAWTNIFEGLMSADLVRAFDEDQLLRSHWLMAYNPDARKWNGSRSIKERFNLKKYRGRNTELLKDLDHYVSSLQDASLAYCDAIKPKRERTFIMKDAQLRKNIRNYSEKLRRIRVSAPFLPLLMATRLRFPTEPQKYFEALQLCERFAFRVYRFLEKRSNTGQSALFRMGYNLYNQRSFEECIKHLRGALLYYCPNRAFESGFLLDDKENNWYKWYGLKYFLYEYEESLAGSESVQLPWDDVYKTDLKNSVEHILPQKAESLYWKDAFTETDFRKYIHDLGNLCLTSPSRNSSYSNKSFPDKQGEPGWKSPCYANSNLFQERSLASVEDWNEDELLKRRERLVKWALQRWSVEDGTEVEEPTVDEDIEEENVEPEDLIDEPPLVELTE